MTEPLIGGAQVPAARASSETTEHALGSVDESLMKSVLDSLEGRTCIVGASGEILYTNRGWNNDVGRLGITDGGVGSNFMNLIRDLNLPPEAMEGVREVVEKAISAEEIHGSAKAGWLWGARQEQVIVRASSITDHVLAKAVIRIIDITRNHATQQKLARITDRAKLLALVAEHTDNSVVILDAQGRIEWINDAFTRLTGYTIEEVIGRPRADLWQGPLAKSRSHDAIQAAIDSGEGIDVEVPAQNKDGRTYWAQIEIQPVLVNGVPVRFVDVERDITMRRTADEQLRAKNQQVHALAERLENEKTLLSTVLGSIPHLVYWKDSNLRYQGVNQAFLAFRGLQDPSEADEREEYELEINDELTELLPTIEREVLASGRAQLNHRVMLGGAHQRRELLLSVLPYGTQESDAAEWSGVVGVAADVTHLSELERQLAQASRLESIGQLAAGIAHEINTPVQYVSDNTRFVAESVGEVLVALRGVSEALSAEQPAEQALEQARSAVGVPDLDFLEPEIPSALEQSLEGLNRVATIVAAMKDFSHPGAERAAVELNRAVESTVKVCSNEWKYVATVDLDLAPDVELVPCYEGELKQVLLNIIVNAAQAIGEQREAESSIEMGRICVSTRRLSDHVEIVIADDGPGMPDSVRQRVFDPFFTTKPVGKGTGQGLNMAYAIVQKHRGRLDVESSPGEGARFTIHLPLDGAAENS